MTDPIDEVGLPLACKACAAQARTGMAGQCPACADEREHGGVVARAARDRAELAADIPTDWRATEDAAPAAPTVPVLYSRDVGGAREVFSMDTNGATTQLTKDGQPGGPALRSAMTNAAIAWAFADRIANMRADELREIERQYISGSVAASDISLARQGATIAYQAARGVEQERGDAMRDVARALATAVGLDLPNRTVPTAEASAKDQ